MAWNQKTILRPDPPDQPLTNGFHCIDKISHRIAMISFENMLRYIFVQALGKFSIEVHIDIEGYLLPVDFLGIRDD